jgi:aryl-alcohol dehydrogenase-like predicted oxidoreductase
LAIAWTIKYPHVDSGLIGARTVAQLEDSLKSLEVLEKLTPELEARILILKNGVGKTAHTLTENDFEELGR